MVTTRVRGGISKRVRTHTLFIPTDLGSRKHSLVVLCQDDRNNDSRHRETSEGISCSNLS